MIEITNKDKCCGCGACSQICPKNCIRMQEDNEGFLYPIVNQSACINCNLCNNICPVINQNSPCNPISAYAAKHTNGTIRKDSSSGGLFSYFAERMIDKGGVVFGARWDANWEVEHAHSETLEGICTFRGSKYLQSRIGDSYQKVESLLKEGREVLFTGTPCQIAGLKKFLQKEYENLLTIDVICHGVSSPFVWRTYLHEKIGNTASIISINMRDKSDGWRKFGLRIDLKTGLSIHEQAIKNTYMKGFLMNLYLRPSCHHCPTRNFKSSSDITIGDFWGGEQLYPNLDYKMGYSIVIANSEKGDKLIENRTADITCQQVSIESYYTNNMCLKDSVKAPKLRPLFWKKFAQSGIDAIDIMCNKMKPSFTSRFILFCKRKFTSLVQ